MSSKNKKTILAGFLGTIVMTMVMMIAPLIGMPKMSPPKMLSSMMKIPQVVGWFLHFMIGIGFAFFYTYLCVIKHKISNVWGRGMLFGIVTFVIAQIVMTMIKLAMPMPKMSSSMLLTMAGSLLGHIVFGITVAKTIGNYYCRDNSC